MPERLLAKALVEKVNEEDGTLEAAVASTPVIDREGEVIEQEGWDLKNYKKNPVLLWMHNIREVRPPIGKVVKLWIEGSGKRAKLMFSPKFDLQDPFASDIFRKFKEGFLNTFSVGFMPIEQEDNIYKAQELLEISAVPVPANPQAQVQLRNAGMETTCFSDICKELGSESGLVGEDQGPKEEPDLEDVAEQALLRDQVQEKPYPNEHACRLEDPKQFDRFNRKNCEQKHDGKCIDVIYGIKEGKSKIQSLRYPKQSWSSAEAKSHCSGRGGSFTAASQSQEEMEAKGVISYHRYPLAQEGADWDAGKEVRGAEVSDLKKMCTWFDSKNPDLKTSYKLPHHRSDGKYSTVWRGVAAAMAALLGARGGVQIPDSDKKSVYNHLKKHYADFDKEVPDYRLVEAQILKDLDCGLETLYQEGSIEYIKSLFKNLKGEIRAKRKPKVEVDDLGALRDALRIVNQATNIALSRLKEKGGEKS